MFSSRIYGLGLGLSFSLASLLVASSAHAAKFQMLKKGEWNVELLESSLGPLAQAMSPKPFCVDDKTLAAGWEERAKQSLSKAGLDCQLKLLKEEANEISYDTDCKATPGEKPSNPLITADSKLKGQVTVVRVSDTEYSLKQDALGSGLKLPGSEGNKIPEGQRKMLESMLGMQDGKLKISMKQKYTFSKADCGAR